LEKEIPTIRNCRTVGVLTKKKEDYFLDLYPFFKTSPEFFHDFIAFEENLSRDSLGILAICIPYFDLGNFAFFITILISP